MKNQEVFLKANAALGEGRYEEFISYCAEDIKWENVGNSTFNGKAELLKYISAAYEGLTFTTENSIEDKDHIVELGQIMLVSNGESQRSTYCDVWKFRDSLICQVTSFVI